MAVPYAKNVLFPQGKAKAADKQAMDAMKQKQQKKQKHAEESQEAFTSLQQWVKDGGIVKIHKNATPQGHLYEKLSVKDIQHAIYEICEISIPTDWIVLDEKVNMIGDHQVVVTYNKKTIKLSLTIQ